MTKKSPCSQSKLTPSMLVAPAFEIDAVDFDRSERAAAVSNAAPRWMAGICAVTVARRRILGNLAE